MRRFIVGICSILVASIAFGQPQPPPYGTQWDFFGHAKLENRISGFSEPNIRVSGTNVNYNVKAGFVQPLEGDPPYAGMEWTYKCVYKIEVFIGGELVDTWNGAETVDKVRNVRFATTHFPDDSTQELKVRAHFYFEFDDGSVVFMFIQYLDSTVHVKIYNKGGVMATQEDVNENTGVYEIQQNPSTKGFSAVSKEIASLARTKLGEMKHSISQSTPTPDHERTKQQILDSLKGTTFWIFSTHGERGKFRSSIGQEITLNPPPNEVVPAIDPGPGVTRTDSFAPGKIPHHNIILFYGCDTLTGQGNDFAIYAKSFGIMDNSGAPTYGVKPDRAWAGFHGKVYSLLRSGAKLTNHAAIVLDMLKDGYDVATALDSANRRDMTITRIVSNGQVIYPDLAMKSQGDKYATIMSVYQGTFILKENRNKWSKVW